MKDLFDLFGEPFKLNYNGKYLFKTSFSATISLLYMIAIVLLGFWNIYNLYQHDGLNMNNYQTIMSKDDPLYPINNSNFYLAFQLFDTNGISIFSQNSSNFSKYFEIYSNYYDGSLFKKLNIIRCNSTVNNLIDGFNDKMCIDFNNCKLGGNYFSINKKNYVSANIIFYYDQVISDLVNNSIDVNLFFPLILNVYYPSASLNLLNFSHPYSNEMGTYNLNLNFNKTKSFQMSTQVIEINTDSSYILNSNQVQNIFTSNFRQFSEEYSVTNPNSPLLEMLFYLDPIKTVYAREYMKLQDVLNNVNSVTSILFWILTFICRRYNAYMLKVDFIQENIMYKGDKDEENIMKIILNLDEPVHLNVDQVSQNSLEQRKDLDAKWNKKIKMKTFFNHLICCKRKQSIQNLVSDFAEDFFDEFVDSRSIILLLAQLKDLKNATLPKYQNIVLNSTKIILNPKDLMIMKEDDNLFQKSFHRVKVKLREQNFDAVDLMLFNKF